MLRQLCGEMAGKAFKSWNTCVKLTWGVPRNAHNYFVHQFLDCGLTSLKTDVLSRYSRFVTQLTESPSAEVSVVANIVTRDLRSNTGENMRFVSQQAGIDVS